MSPGFVGLAGKYQRHTPRVLGTKRILGHNRHPYVTPNNDLLYQITISKNDDIIALCVNGLK